MTGTAIHRPSLLRSGLCLADQGIRKMLSHPLYYRPLLSHFLTSLLFQILHTLIFLPLFPLPSLFFSFSSACHSTPLPISSSRSPSSLLLSLQCTVSRSGPGREAVGILRIHSHDIQISLALNTLLTLDSVPIVSSVMGMISVPLSINFRSVFSKFQFSKPNVITG